MSISSISGSSGTNHLVSGPNRQSGNISAYFKDLTSKYKVLTPSNSASVTIGKSVLRKAMNNESTGKWLEDNLKAIPDVMEKTISAVNVEGSRLDYVSMEITGEDEITMVTITTTDAASPNDDLEKWLEKIRDKNKGMTKEENDKVDDLMKKIKVIPKVDDQGNMSLIKSLSPVNTSNAVDYYA